MTVSKPLPKSTHKKLRNRLAEKRTSDKASIKSLEYKLPKLNSPQATPDALTKAGVTLLVENGHESHAERFMSDVRKALSQPEPWLGLVNVLFDWFTLMEPVIEWREIPTIEGVIALIEDTRQEVPMHESGKVEPVGVLPNSDLIYVHKGKFVHSNGTELSTDEILSATMLLEGGLL